MRKWIDIVSGALLEKVFYSGPVKPRYYSVETDLVVYKNPTKQEYVKLASGTETVRAFWDDPDAIYMWDGFDFTHGDFHAFFGIDGSDLFFENHGIRWNDCDPNWTDKAAERAAKELKANRVVVAIYGPDARIFMEASDSDQTWEF